MFIDSKVQIDKLIPVLNKNWVIKGTKEKPRLINLKSSKIIVLGDMEVVEYIKLCNGTYSIQDIFNKYNDLSIDIIYDFYNKFKKEGALSFNEKKKETIININLGNKEPWLKEVHIDITNNCNLRCRHCFWGDNLGYEKNSDFKNWSNAIDNMKNSGVAKIVLSGGEALTSCDLPKFIKKIHDNNMIISAIFTNGTLWNTQFEESLKFIIDNNMFTTFYISLDGFNSEQHDFIRGKGNFDKTLDFIDKIKNIKQDNNCNFEIVINSLIHKKNYKDLISWYEFLYNIGVDKWRFTTGRIVGNLSENTDIIKISLKEAYISYVEFIEFIISKYKNGEKIIKVNAENFFSTNMLDTKKMYVFNDDLNICDYKFNGCSIDPQGNMQFCTSWQGLKFGNVFEENIENIWHNPEIRKLKEMKISQITECKECKYLYLCGGGCRLECKDIYSKDKNICENFEIFDNYILPLLSDVGVELTSE